MKTAVAFLVAVALWVGTAVDVQAHSPYVTYYRSVPHAVYYAPALLAPAPFAYQPVTLVRTRYRPFLGGTVTRVRYGYAPLVYQPVPVVCAY